VSYWGYSQLALYTSCPKRYWYERIQKRPDATFDPRNAFIGTLLGQLVAQFYAERWWARGAEAKRLMVHGLHGISNDLQQVITYPWARGEWEDKMAVATAAIDPILAVVVRERLIASRVDIELPVEVPLGGGDILTGTPDLVLDTAGALILLDAKAGATVGRYVKSDQLRLYQLGVAAHPRYGRLPDKVGFWWLRHGRIVWKRTPKDALHRWLDGVRRTIARIRAADFVPTPSPLCRFCAFRSECPEGTASMRVVKVACASDEAVGITSL
jgi:hypothetical protein